MYTIVQSQKGNRGKRKGKQEYDRSFFSVINPISSYIAGFIAADGWLSVTKTGKYVGIRLKQDDLSILEQIAIKTNFNGNIYLTKNQCLLRYSSANQWYEDLHKVWNITERKSLTALPPIGLDHHNSLCFIKGLLDGDGQINIYKWNIAKIGWRLRTGFSGTESMMLWVQKILSQEIPELQDLKLRTLGKIRELIFEGEKAYKIAILLEKLDTPALHRKYDNAHKWLKIYQDYYNSFKPGEFVPYQKSNYLMSIIPK